MSYQKKTKVQEQRSGGRNDDDPFEDVVAEFREALQEGLRLQARLTELLQRQSDGTLQEEGKEELVQNQRSVDMFKEDESQLYRGVKTAFDRLSKREKKQILRVARGDAVHGNHDSELLFAIFPAFRKINDLMEEFTVTGNTMTRAKNHIAAQVRYIASEVIADDKKELMEEKKAYEKEYAAAEKKFKKLVLKIREVHPQLEAEEKDILKSIYANGGWDAIINHKLIAIDIEMTQRKFNDELKRDFDAALKKGRKLRKAVHKLQKKADRSRVEETKLEADARDLEVFDNNTEPELYKGLRKEYKKMEREDRDAVLKKARKAEDMDMLMVIFKEMYKFDELKRRVLESYSNRRDIDAVPKKLIKKIRSAYTELDEREKKWMMVNLLTEESGLWSVVISEDLRPERRRR